MIKNYRVAGLVTYETSKGLRLAIPAGQIIEVDQRDFEVDGHQYVATMTWTDSKGKQWLEKWTPAFWAQLVRTQIVEV